MNRKAASAGIIALASVGLLGAPACALEIRTLVMAFGQKPIGQSIATIFSLQISRTLRKQPVPNPRELDFGKGVIVWDQSSVGSHDFAESKAKRPLVSAQHVLWGRVHAIGTDAVVTAYLTMPKYFDFRTQPNEVWTIKIKQAGTIIDLAADVPQRFYAFEPILLSREFVETYSTPERLKVLATPGSSRVIGPIGPEWNYLKHEGAYSQVVDPKGRLGWVYLPELSKNQPEIIEFISGIIRVYRGDWEGALEVFGGVSKNERVPTSIRIDSMLYILRSKSELGMDAKSEMASLRELAPASRRVLQYITMYILSRCYVRPGECSSDERSQLRSVLERARSYFPDSDPWYMAARGVIIPN